MASILVIDDDVEYAEDIRAILSDAGHEVSTLDHTDGAMEYLIDCTPDVLVLDVMFPDQPVAGFDLARKISHEPKTRSLPIVLLTGMNQEFPMDFSADDIDPNWMPVQDFVEKPVEPGRLLGAIDRLTAS